MLTFDVEHLLAQIYFTGNQCQLVRNGNATLFPILIHDPKQQHIFWSETALPKVKPLCLPDTKVFLLTSKCLPPTLQLAKYLLPDHVQCMHLSQDKVSALVNIFTIDPMDPVSWSQLGSNQIDQLILLIPVLHCNFLLNTLGVCSKLSKCLVH